MKFVGKINLTKTELLDIIFGNESIALDKTIFDQFFKPKPKQEVCTVNYEKIREIITENLEKLGQSKKLVEKQSEFNKEASFIKGFLLVLILHLISKKGGVRLQTVEFLINVINSPSVQLEKLGLATNPWEILTLFFEEGPCGESVKGGCEDFKGFLGLTEKEKEIIVRGLEKIYVLSVALQQVEIVGQYLGLSFVSYAYYCENEHINTEFLQLFEKKSSFQRNISFVAGSITNLLQNSTLKKTSPSSEDINWVELCGQSKYNLAQLMNSIIEELNLDEDGLNIKGVDRTLQTVNQLSLALAGSLTCQMENALNRINITSSNQQNEQFKEFLVQKLNEISTLCDQFQGSLSFRVKSKGFGEEVPYILNMGDYYNSLRKMIEIEAFMNISLLDVKRKLLNPVLTPEQEEAERIKREEQEKKMSEKQKQKKREAGEKKKKKIGFGAGTNLIFDLFVSTLELGDIENAQENYQKFVAKFFNIQNQDLMQLYQELTAAKNSDRRGVKIAKGAQDFGGNEMALRRSIFNTVTQTFRDHGAVEIDTPVFELKETLTGKYGEDSKLIYDLEDQGGELLSLRYDLTVPFARFMAMQNKTSIKRYQVQKVYRRDQPNISRGRFREFYQCDLDICGKGDCMLQDCEIIKVFDSILKKLEFDNFVIKINNRKILDAMIQISGAPANKFKAICSAIDKLDKEPWANVQKELIEQKGIAVEAVNKIETFVNGKYTGKPEEVIENLKKDKVFDGNKLGEEALAEMTILFSYLKQLNCVSNASFDLSLARGLDYYTGMIFEIVLTGENVGSIAGGGRYDELIGMFKDKKDALPAVGGSLGIERVYRILKSRNTMKKFTETQVLVCTIGNFSEEKLKICSELWEAGIKAEYLYKEKEKSQKQLEYAIYNNIPFTIWIGESEVQEQIVSLKNMYKKEEQKYKRSEYIDVLKQQIEQYNKDAAEGKVEYYVESEQQQQKQPEKKQPEKKQPKKQEKEEEKKSE